MTRMLGALLLAALLALVAAPLASMFVASVTCDEVRTVDGERILGQKRDSDAKGVAILPFGETVTRGIPRSEVTREGRAFTLRHYEGVLAGRSERNMLLATLALAGASTLAALLLGLPLGLLFAATDLPGRRFLENFCALPLVLPPIFLAIATYRDLLHLKPEFLRAVVVFGLSLFPIVALFVARAVRATGAEALNAARVAAPPREALLRAALGPALPGAAAGALLCFSFVVADFAVPDFLGVTTAKNTITVYANAVFQAWNRGDAGEATAAGMPAALLGLGAFLLLLRVERRRSAAALAEAGAPGDPDPIPLGRARIPLGALAALLLAAAVLWPSLRHLETAGGAHFGREVARSGVAATQVASEGIQKPKSVADGLRRGLRRETADDAALLSLELAGLAALVATLLALGLVEAGRGRRRLDAAIALLALLPIAVPPMSLAVGWARLFGRLGDLRLFPSLLLAARLLPFAYFPVRAARARVDEGLLDAAAVAGLSPLRRAFRVAFPLTAPGVRLGLLLSFLFGLREVDAIIFTRSGAETLPVKLYNWIHYGHDVEVGALAFFWTLGVALLLAAAALARGRFLRFLP